MLEVERVAFDSGFRAEDFMEQAGLGIAGVVRQFHPRPGHCIVFVGKGHNGGDALVAARHLRGDGWSVEIRAAFDRSHAAPLTAARWFADSPAAISSGPLVVLDGLLGLGASGNPRGGVAAAIEAIQALRRRRGAWVLAVDLPSGLGADLTVEADVTATIGFPKTPLLEDEATKFTGRLAVIPLPGLIPPSGVPFGELIVPAALEGLLPPRNFETHKGQAGRVAVIAGSEGFPGAARLCATGALRAGAGLVTLYTCESVLPALASSLPPEVMLRPRSAWNSRSEPRFDAIAVGPGMVRASDEEIRRILRSLRTPSVLDADALRPPSRIRGGLLLPPHPCLLTPHPGEMERLLLREGRDRQSWAEAFVRSHPATLLLKGARTIVAQRNKPVFYNTTGHPGMASGGMGDVLSGVAAALLAQGKSPLDAAKISAWTCGHAAEIALRGGLVSQESLTASDVLENLGAAFCGLRAGVY
jgi:NAD(P)H-hydrate epimerase